MRKARIAVWTIVGFVLMCAWNQALPLPSTAARTKAVSRLEEAVQFYHQGKYAECAKQCAGLNHADLLNPESAQVIEAQCLFYSGQKQKARERFAKLAQATADSPYATWAAYRQADCDWELGRQQLAVAEYLEAFSLPEDPGVDQAVGLFHRIEYWERLGKTQESQRSWWELMATHPRHPLAAAAPKIRPMTRVDINDALRTAATLHGMRRWEEALAALDGAPDPRNDQERFDLAFRTGRILFDMPGRKEEAARMMLTARDHAPTLLLAQKAWFWGSRAMTRSGRVDESIASHLAMVDRFPKGTEAAQALFYAGFLAQDQGRCEQALLIFKRLLERFPNGSLAVEARWFTAWCQLQQQQWNDAVDTLTRQTTYLDVLVAGRALYWSAFAQQMLGQESLAQSLWRQILDRFPLTWYSLLAQLRLDNKLTFPKPPPAPTPFPQVTDSVLEQAKELIKVGLPALAYQLLIEHQSDFFSEHPDRAALLSLIALYRQTGDYHQPWRLSLIRDGFSLRRLPTPATRALWDHAYPPCAREQLTKQTASDDELLLLLQAIMRQESGFDPQALSIADARGLLQMTPGTGQQVAARLGIDFVADDLFLPDYNVVLSAQHVIGLAAKFHRQWPLVAAAYNAGVPAVTKWLRNNGHLPLDRFVETIPFSETRNYVKVVSEGLLRYAYLEQKPPPNFSIILQPDFLDDGINY